MGANLGFALVYRQSRRSDVVKERGATSCHHEQRVKPLRVVWSASSGSSSLSRSRGRTTAGDAGTGEHSKAGHLVGDDRLR